MALLNATLIVNGVRHAIEAQSDRSLLDILRNELSLKGSHFGCGQGLCGACMVLLEDRAVHACDTPYWSAVGKHIITIEGLAAHSIGASLQQAFFEQGAAQCGYCTSGMLISATALLMATPQVSEQEIRNGMDGNLCRCGVHLRVIRAVAQVSQGLAPEAS